MGPLEGDGISALIKEVPESCLTPSAMLGCGQKTPSVKQIMDFHKHQICWCLGFGLPNLQNYEKHISIALKVPSS
jgi:hypothetical protein